MLMKTERDLTSFSVYWFVIIVFSPGKVL